MITFAQLQADPNNMELANAYVAQQANMLNAQGGTGSSIGSPNLTLGQQYMAGNPDVQQDAIRRANAEGLTGGDAFSNRLDEIALEHYNNFGRAEGRTGYGYSAPSAGSFNPSPNDTPSFGAGDRGYTNTAGTNINPGTGQPFTPPPGQTGLGSMPGGNNQSQQPGFDNSAYETALGNFGGLLNSYGDFFGGLLSGAQNPGTMQPANGFYAPGQMPSYFGFNAGQNFTGTMGGGYGGSGGWNAGPSGGGGFGGAANTGHRQLWTT